MDKLKCAECKQDRKSSLFRTVEINGVEKTICQICIADIANAKSFELLITLITGGYYHKNEGEKQ